MSLLNAISSNDKYRADIDGLRAIAVLSVVLFHLNPTFLPGGFVGVDIFFVISGFLITSIISKEIKEKRFSFHKFYVRRITRILPIFYLVIAVTLLTGFLLLSPSEYKSLSNSAIAANSFLANFRFALTGNYFQEENMRPLLHLWSLAVEEQFYFVWPLLLIGLIKLKSKYLLSVVGLIIIFSFVLAEVASAEVRYATFSYYMLPTRMGELLLGAMLALANTEHVKPNLKNLLSFIGLALVIFSIVIIDGTYVFPGWYSLLPCLGTTLIIAAGKQTIVNQLIANKVFVFFGLISYSLYLWHWPIIVFYKYHFSISHLSLASAFMLFTLMVLMSYLSTNWFENRFRKTTLPRQQVYTRYFVAPLFALYSVGFFVSLNNGLPQRFGLDHKMTTVETIGCHDKMSDETCYIHKGGESEILLIGDSHAGHFSNFFQVLGKEINVTVIDASASGCKFYAEAYSSLSCEAIKEKVSRLVANVDTLIVAKRVENMYRNEEELTEFVDYVKSNAKVAKNVFVLSQVPRNLNDRFIDQYIKSLSGNGTLTPGSDDHVLKANDRLEAAFELANNIEVIRFEKEFCEQDDCVQFDDSGQPLYFDDDHLSAHGSEWLARKVLSNDKYVGFLNALKSAN